MYCVAISSNYTLEIKRLKAHYKKITTVTQYGRAVHLDLNGDVFFFAYGAVVAWGEKKFDEQELEKILQEFKGAPLGAKASDTHKFRYGQEAKVVNDEIILPDNKVPTKLAFSHALAQSVKLMGLESQVSTTSEQTRHIPHVLALKGKINLSRKKIRILMGELLVNKNAANLHLELLNTPKFFWHHPELEPYYEIASEYIDLDQRVEVLNQRIEVMHSVFEMLTAELYNQHGAFLEWIIIGLISFEIVLSLLHIH